MQQTTTFDAHILLTGGTTIQATVKAMVRAATGRVRLMVRLWVERRQLATLSKDQLADMGIAPEDASRESQRPFWDIPSGR